MKKQYTKPLIKIDELLNQDIILTSETNPTTAEGAIISDGPAEGIDFG